MAEDAQGTGDERSGMRNGLAANRLRHISVHVIEPAPGRYFWVLLEQGTEGAAWVDMLESQKPCKHWNHALTDGMAALIDLAGDVREGPRAVNTHENPSASGMDVSLRNW
ncbi:hypothetical protein ACEN9J_37545 [Variovorax sp. Varisp41]|jgi:hypothetical protein|uniref:hypothetical protein n=1 Tax=Variovorax sp. Varisp41 TaxID=3243033 RepID=UPI0039B55DB0